jgi:hypothetical protein
VSGQLQALIPINREARRVVGRLQSSFIVAIIVATEFEVPLQPAIGRHAVSRRVARDGGVSCCRAGHGTAALSGNENQSFQGSSPR